MDNPHIQKISTLLQSGNKFLVCAHYNPDGDAIGSTVAMGHILKALGKSVTLYNETGMPDQFSWLELPAELVTQIPDEDFDYVIALDCGARARLGKAMDDAFPTTGSINIDHHLGNPLFAEHNWVGPEFPAVGEMVAQLAMALDIPLAGPLGESIYLALVTDTGNFSFSNTRPETHELAAEILRQGLDNGAFNARLQNQWTPGRLKLWSRLFDNARFHFCDQVGIFRISQNIFDETGTTREDAEGVVNYIRRVKTVKAAVLLREDGPGITKISMRSSGGVNVQEIAASLGGGGHRNAAGVEISADMDEAERAVLDACAHYLEYT